MFRTNFSIKSLAAVFMMSAAVVVSSCKKDKDKDEDKTVPVTGVTLTSAATTVAGTPLTLAATVEPASATSKTIVWSVKSAGTTGAAIVGNVLNVPTAGTATVTATIAKGAADGKDFTKDFTISVTSLYVAVSGVTLTSGSGFVAGTTLELAATVAPASATNQTIVWSVKTDGTTAAGAAITDGNKLTATAAGTVKVTATIAGGATSSTAYTQDFDIVVTTPTLSLTPAEQTEVKFKADGTADGNATFAVTTNQTSWDATSDQTWVTVEKTATGFTLNALENTAITASTPATVTVSATNTTPIVINVTQAAAAPTLSLTPAEQTEVKFKADGTADGNATFTVATNQPSWDAVSNQTWVTVEKTATGFTLSAEANTIATAPAAAIVYVTAGTATVVTLTVTQAAATPTLSLTPAGQTDIAFAADGTTTNNTTFTVNTNTGGYNVVASASWVTVEKTATSFTIVSTKSFYTYETAIVTVSAGTAPSIVINITQTAKAVPADGVVINGVVWAKYNIDTYGIFAATPESAGKLYQWNRETAWDVTGDISGWDASVPTGDTWTANICPPGWRLPTEAEVSSLCTGSKVTYTWTNQNGVNGGLFTDKSTNATLFLPAAGNRFGNIGTPSGAGTWGVYWSSTANSTTYLLFGGSSSNQVGMGDTGNHLGAKSVRCVLAE